MQSLSVSLGERSYDIIICSDCLRDIGKLFHGVGLKQKLCIITNPKIDRYFGKKISQYLKNAGFKASTFIIPDGERYKTLKTVSGIYDKLVSLKFERNSTLVALGGGVVGDITGFAAATYLRGVPYVQIPTTLLAQVDSSVGGKTGVDHKKGKNLIGSFYQPKLVVVDINTLQTLPRREFIAGMAEVVKYGVIADEGFLSYLEENVGNILSLKKDKLMDIIKMSCKIKARIVEEDEKEISGKRALLNFGHTFGHAIETITGYRKFRHGEAVAIGMVLASKFAVKLNICKMDIYIRIRNLLTRIGLPVDIEGLNFKMLLKVMELDKKVSDQRIRFILPQEIGKMEVCSNWKVDDLRKVIEKKRV